MTPLGWITAATVVVGIVALGPLGLTAQRYSFGRDFFASFDEDGTASRSTVVDEERLRQVTERLYAHVDLQLAALQRRVDALEKSMHEMRQAISHDWNATDSGLLYKIFTTKKSWNDAQALCRLFGSQLAVIDSEYKNEYVREMIVNQYGPAGSNVSESSDHDSNEKKNGGDDATQQGSTELWIGLKTRAEMVGAGGPQQYTNFSDEEKIDGCTTINWRGKWKIRPCNSPRHFICQQINVF